MHLCKSVLCFEKENVCKEKGFMEFAHLYLFITYGSRLRYFYSEARDSNKN